MSRGASCSGGRHVLTPRLPFLIPWGATGPGSFQGNPKGASTEAPQRGRAAGWRSPAWHPDSHRLEKGALIPSRILRAPLLPHPLSCPPKPSPSYKTGVQGGTREEGRE